MDRKKEKMAAGSKHIVIAGGKLQGTELVYLAKKAGYTVTLLDRQANVPAAGLADTCITADIFDKKQVWNVLCNADYVIPAIEDLAVLDALEKYCREIGVPYIFDRTAYRISSSKSRTNNLLKKLGIRIPEEFPGCGYPIICKPDEASGSKDVKKIESQEQWEDLQRHSSDTYVVQQYLSGPSYSLEVLGNGTQGVFPMITEVITDAAYDCKRIIAPAKISPALEKEFLQIAKEINHSLHICGIFDIEVILHKDCLFVLEIDARFPSQTPISIFHAAGINFVEMLAAFADGEPVQKEAAPGKSILGKVCIYQQILVKNDTIKVCGEHIMSVAGPLQVLSGFCGADEMLTDYMPDAKEWRAIVILTGTDKKEVDVKWEKCLREIAVLQGYEENMRYIEG